MNILGEHWTRCEIADALHTWSAICEGVPVIIGIDRVRELEQRGLLMDVKELPGRGRYSGRFTFNFTGKLEKFVKEYRQNNGEKPNCHPKFLTPAPTRE